jgi:hypothetical protein
MEALIQYGYIEWVVECYISNSEPLDHPRQHPNDLQVLFLKHQKVFGDIPPGVPPDRGFEHIIELEEGVQSVIPNPYRHPKMYKDEIEKTLESC